MKVKNGIIGVRAFSRIAAASDIGGMGCSPYTPWGLGISQIHAIGDTGGLGLAPQIACVFSLGSALRIAAASCLGGMGYSPYTPRGLGILPNTRHRRYGAWGLPNSLRLSDWGSGILPNSGSVKGFCSPLRNRTDTGAWGTPHIHTIGDIPSIADKHTIGDMPLTCLLVIPPKFFIFFRLCIEFCKGSPSVQLKDFGLFRDIAFGEGAYLSVHCLLQMARQVGT